MKVSRILLVATLAVAAFAPATSALAAAAVPTATPHMDVQMWPDEQPGRSTVVAVAQFTTATALPVKVRLPLPKGGTVTWAGEIHEGGPQDDVARKFELVQGDGGQVVEFTIEGSRIAQYEATYPGSATSGNRLVSKLAWVQSASATDLQFGFRLPRGVGDVQSDPPYMGQPARNEVGETLYSVPLRKLTLGAAFDMSVSYVPAAAVTLPVTTSGSATSLVLPVLLVLLAVVLAALLAVVFRQNSRREDEVAEDPDESGAVVHQPEEDRSEDDEADPME